MDLVIEGADVIVHSAWYEGRISGHTQFPAYLKPRLPRWSPEPIPVG
jgi:hypothetical protein